MPFFDLSYLHFGTKNRSWGVFARERLGGVLGRPGGVLGRLEGVLGASWSENQKKLEKTMENQ